MPQAKTRIVAVFLALSLALAAVACGQDDDPPSNDVGSWVNPTSLAR